MRSIACLASGPSASSTKVSPQSSLASNISRIRSAGYRLPLAWTVTVLSNNSTQLANSAAGRAWRPWALKRVNSRVTRSISGRNWRRMIMGVGRLLEGGKSAGSVWMPSERSRKLGSCERYGCQAVKGEGPVYLDLRSLKQGRSRFSPKERSPGKRRSRRGARAPKTQSTHQGEQFRSGLISYF